MSSENWDLVIVGAGPAGVSAALYAYARGLKYCVCEAEQVGGLASHVSRLSHFVGLDICESGQVFGSSLRKQLEDYQTPLIQERVERLELEADGGKVLTLASGRQLHCRALIMATGSRPKRHTLAQGLDSFSHWAGQNEDLAGSRVFVLGGSDGAIKESLYLAQRARAVEVVQNAPRLLCVPEFQQELQALDNVQVHLGAELVAVSSPESFDLDWLEIREASGQLRRYTASTEEKLHIYTHIGQVGSGQLLEGRLPLEEGFVRSEVESEIPGLYLAGDVRVKAIRQVATAVSEGCEAAIKAARYLQA